jgi:hypothetical protein
MQMVYRWADKAVVPIDAQIAGEMIEDLRKKTAGLFKPAVVVDAARPETSPLHPAFDWDDSVAAEKWRQDQARHMIRSLVITVNAGNKQVATRAFVSVTHEKSPLYTSISNALSDTDMRAQIVGRALRELQGWQQRYSTYAELSDISAAIEKRLQAESAPKQVRRVA